jgi:hypothetical protein
MTLIVNTVGGPGSGKSTLSYGLIAKLKAEGVLAELVTEYAKDLTWRRDFAALGNQFEVTREQDRRLRDLLGQVDIIVHDTAIPLGLIYCPEIYREPWFEKRVWALYESYNNFTVFVKRKKKFQQTGRNQTEAEAKAIDHKILDLFGPALIDLSVDGNTDAVDIVYHAIMRHLGKE